jgi:steroid 5-alpha reductase family enzyme
MFFYLFLFLFARRLNEYYTRLKALKSSRDSRYLKLTEKLEARVSFYARFFFLLDFNCSFN